MDSSKLNSDGSTPIKSDLEKIAALKNTSELVAYLPSMMQEGINPFFNIYVDADPMNSNQYLVQTYQGGIGLSQRDYYLENDDNTRNIREKYIVHIAQMFEKSGFTADEAANKRDAVMRVEMRLATSAYDNVKLRDPHANYNKMTVAELQKLVPQLDWNSFFNGFQLNGLTDLSVSQKENLVEVGKIIATEPLEVQKA